MLTDRKHVTKKEHNAPEILALSMSTFKYKLSALVLNILHLFIVWY